MSFLSAHFFRRLQAAGFYEDLHREAVSLLPEGHGASWLDVGCGPGLVARLAAERGYAATGVDIDPAMIRLARSASPSGVAFRVADLASVSHEARQADVISAASLLAVLPVSDRRAALRTLTEGLKAGGILLLIEPSQEMTPQRASEYLHGHKNTRGAWALRLWARTRQPQRVVTAEQLRTEDFSLSRRPLLDGLVNAWILRADNYSSHL